LAGRVVDENGGPVEAKVVLTSPIHSWRLADGAGPSGWFDFRGDIDGPLHWRVEPKDPDELEAIEGDLPAPREDLRIVVPRTPARSGRR
jgi:hypothetical protein